MEGDREFHVAGGDGAMLLEPVAPALDDGLFPVRLPVEADPAPRLICALWDDGQWLPPDVKYVDQIRKANTFARDHELGFWSGCTTDANGDTKELTRAQGIVSPPKPLASVQEVPSGKCDPSYPDVCIP